MTLSVRDGSYDVAIVAAPGVAVWPSVGVRALSVVCSEIGLNVGLIGGGALQGRGVIPLPDTGGIVIAEDPQKRIHRIHARSVVRVSPSHTFVASPFGPELFSGWHSRGLLPFQTAQTLWAQGKLNWGPSTAILGTGNEALKFASALLESGVPEVFCLESRTQWGEKNYAGWEVERRHFEMLGGKIYRGRVLRLTELGPLTWQLHFRVGDEPIYRNVAWVVAAGPFYPDTGLREYPPGSLLFEIEQTAHALRAAHVEGWTVEEERGKRLGVKIAKALSLESDSKRENLDRVLRRSRSRIRRMVRHQEAPFKPEFEGKWISAETRAVIQEFSSVPKKVHRSRLVASVECFEDIPCHICEATCPEDAIRMEKFGKGKRRILRESDCTACGLCLEACPSQSILMIHEKEEQSFSSATFPWRSSDSWAVGDFATLVNRRGEVLGQGRVTLVQAWSVATGSLHQQLVTIDVPSHLIWEARGLKFNRKPDHYAEQSFRRAFASDLHEEARVDITLDGEVRRVRDRVPLTVALFEMGRHRADDGLLCPDGSCGLCEVEVDGINALACATQVRAGMTVSSRAPKKFLEELSQKTAAAELQSICPCLNITREEVLDRIRQGNLHSAEAILQATHVGEGKCHGQWCMGEFRRILLDHGLEGENWIDWRFPWVDWEISS